jgi:hypothetical protein
MRKKWKRGQKMQTAQGFHNLAHLACCRIWTSIIVRIIVTIVETVVGDVTLVEGMIVTRVFEGGIITVGIISQMIIIDERIKGGMVQTNNTEVIKLMPITDQK